MNTDEKNPAQPCCAGGNPAEKPGGPCEMERCQACCPHDEFDHYVCMDCDYEKCPGDDIDAAELQYGDDR